MQETEASQGNDFTVRRASPDDIPSVINVNALTLPEHYSEYFYYEILKDFPNTFLIAESKGTVAGYIMCRLEYGLSMTRRFGLAKKGHIISVAVLQEHRNKGVGSKLIKEALEEIRTENGKECYLEVRITNQGAIELYKRIGFKTNSTLHGYYKDGESAYTMAMPL
jgi:[ribosomal protein S18]-alanine N-acetyltransferase